MEYPWVRVVLFTIFAIYDIGMALYYSYVMELPTNVSRDFMHQELIGFLFLFIFFCILYLKFVH